MYRGSRVTCALAACTCMFCENITVRLSYNNYRTVTIVKTFMSNAAFFAHSTTLSVYLFHWPAAAAAVLPPPSVRTVCCARSRRACAHFSLFPLRSSPPLHPARSRFPHSDSVFAGVVWRGAVVCRLVVISISVSVGRLSTVVRACVYGLSSWGARAIVIVVLRYLCYYCAPSVITENDPPIYAIILPLVQPPGIAANIAVSSRLVPVTTIPAFHIGILSPVDVIVPYDRRFVRCAIRIVAFCKWTRSVRRTCGLTVADVLLWLWSAPADTRGCQCRWCRARRTVRSVTTSRPALLNSFSTLNNSLTMPHSRPTRIRSTTNPTGPLDTVPSESSGKSYASCYR